MTQEEFFADKWKAFFSRMKRKRLDFQKRKDDTETRARLENTLNELPDLVSRSMFISKLTSDERILIGL